jgi:hypothetical protein
MPRGVWSGGILQGDPVNYLTGFWGWRFSAQKWLILPQLKIDYEAGGRCLNLYNYPKIVFLGITAGYISER